MRVAGCIRECIPVIYHPAGCEHCRHSGYSGRSGAYELIAIDETLRTMIHDRVLNKNAEIRARIISQFAARWISAGVDGDTSLEEVLRVTGED